ncbi:MAG: extracellular solute-binding protein, partial [Cytophagaceae bacterium]|nr:extracellular solute-binding protein [Cytophagaceae bacterium]
FEETGRYVNLGLTHIKYRFQVVDDLARQYDLLLVDHPFIRTAARNGLFVPMGDYVPTLELVTLQEQSAGPSFKSYLYDDHLWALPVDAATQVSVARIDWFAREGRTLPANWGEVVLLAKETGGATSGKVGMPMAPMGLLCGFFSLYANQFEPPFIEDEWAIDTEKAAFVCQQLKDLYDIIGPEYLTQYPVALLNRMAQTDTLVYMPICFGYANYGMAGYAANRLTFGPLPGSRPNAARPDGATLGGVGITVSASSKYIETAVDYCRWVAGAECQSTIYALAGGQPANRVAWESPLLNSLTTNFYENTRETLEKAFVRPRFDGFHHFQTEAARLLQQFLRDGLPPEPVINQLKSTFETARHYAISH